MTPSMNSVKPRKTLASQLDRLDRILDGFADSLNGAVAESVKDAVAVAVKEAVKEVLTSPALQQRLQEAQNAIAPTEAKQPIVRRIGTAMAAFWTRVKSFTKSGCHVARASAIAGYQRAKTAVANYWLFAKAKARAAVKHVRLATKVLILLARKTKKLLWHYRKPVLLVVGTGAVIGLSCYFAGPYLVALATAVCCGGLAGAAGDSLPQVERIIPYRRMLSRSIAS